ncbi:MAG: redoxin domain-containing protein [Pirellulaceae bacterium]|nr:redoxin domain-containing protein [Pirellulaceae bacterium]
MKTRMILGLLFLAGWFGMDGARFAAAEGTPQARTISNFELPDYRGKTWSLAEFKEKRAIVVVFVGTECPLVGQYAARLQTLADKYAASGVQVLAIDANQQDSLAELASFARQHKLSIPVLKDGGNRVADKFQAERTPEAFLLDRQRRVVFQGRIDDQFTYGIARPKVEREYLVAAIDELLADKPISTPMAEPVGCHIGRVLKPQAGSDVTYSKQIARIFNDHCVQCHRAGEIGPFALTNYEEVVGWAAMIREVVSEQRMPPWHANPKHGKFANDTRLSDEEKSQIERWVAAGAPEGDKRDLPPSPQFTTGWQIGEPDAVVYMRDKPFDVPAAGEVRYQYFVADPGFTEDKWIQAAECRPGNRGVVHHIIVGLAPGVSGGQRNREVGGVHSEWLTATAPGARPLILPEGMAKLVPAGSKLVFQMHYTPNGTAQSDRSCVGFKFADPATVRKQVGTDKATNHGFRIPPGDSNHHVEAYRTFERDTLMLAMFPHMHLRGKAFRYTAIYPTGDREILLDVPRYDFNWQNSYEFAEAKLLPKGTRLFCEAWFDNSSENLANPDPTDTVRWGDQTWEEMMIGYFDAAPADQNLKLVSASEPTRTDEFLLGAKAGKTKLTSELKSLAKEAVESDQGLAKLSVELKKIVPQVDRICWTSLADGKLVVRRCTQEPELEKIVGGAGRKVDSRLTKLASYIGKPAPVAHQRLADERGFDLAFMARAYGSSLHIPAEIAGEKGTLNFWSADLDAFPPAAVQLLAEIAAEARK